jgi:four helix bundle protein
MAFRFENLEIWKMARAYAATVYTMTGKFPRHEDYGLRSQMNRAGNSVSLIAEGAAKGTKRGFGYHLEIAVGSVFEVVAGSFLAVDREYIDGKEQQAVYEQGTRLAKSINAFRQSLR